MFKFRFMNAVTEGVAVATSVGLGVYANAKQLQSTQREMQKKSPEATSWVCRPFFMGHKRPITWRVEPITPPMTPSPKK